MLIFDGFCGHVTEENKGRLKNSGTDQDTVPDVVTSVLQPLEMH